MAAGSGTCPTCGKLAPRDGEVAPFCSKRCKTEDLGKWFLEQYRIPVKGPLDDAEDEGDGSGTPASSDDEDVV